MSLANELKKQLDRLLGVPLVYTLRLGDRIRGRRCRGRAADPRRVLLIKLWGLGNLTMILPLVRAVRQQLPEAELEFLTLEQNREFLEGLPWIDRVHLFRSRGVLGSLRSLLRLAIGLRRRRFDLVLDFEQFLKTTAILTRLLDARASVGFRTTHQARHGLHSIEVEYATDRHMASVFADIIRAAGLSLPGNRSLMVPRSASASRRVRELLESWRPGERPLVALHVGSGDNFPGRRWPSASFAKLADRLIRERNALIVFTGTARERALIADCRSRMRFDSVDASGLFRIVELIEFLARVDLLVSNDTAPVHFGSALEIDLIAIYGPNTPALYGPLHSGARVFYSGLPCSPCITNTNAKTSYCRQHVCMSSIDGDQIAAAALDRLGRLKRPGQMAPRDAHPLPAQGLVAEPS